MELAIQLKCSDDLRTYLTKSSIREDQHESQVEGTSAVEELEASFEWKAAKAAKRQLAIIVSIV
jgi:hypothetical protein